MSLITIFYFKRVFSEDIVENGIFKNHRELVNY